MYCHSVFFSIRNGGVQAYLAVKCTGRRKRDNEHVLRQFRTCSMHTVHVLHVANTRSIYAYICTFMHKYNVHTYK